MRTPTRQAARPSPTTLVGVLALLAALLVLPLALAPRAVAFVYWADSDQHAIGRANLDGTGVDEIFSTGSWTLQEAGYVCGTPPCSPRSVAVDSRYIYWGESRYIYPGSSLDVAIARARLDGTHVDEGFVPGVYAADIAVDDDHIYWTDGSQPGAIGRANLDGSGVEKEFITGFAEGRTVAGIAVDDNHIYWTNSDYDYYPNGSIGRANLDGTAIDRAFIPFPEGSAPFAVEVDAAHVYWASDYDAIGRANLDGTGIDQRFIDGESLEGVLAVDAGHIYWGEDDWPFRTIARADLDGANVDHGFISLSQPASLYGFAVNFSLGKLKLDEESGTGKLTVEVPAPGDVALARTAKLKGAELRAEAAGKVRLPIKPQGKAKRKLAEKGKAKVKAEVTYTPDGGEPETQTATLRLKR